VSQPKPRRCRNADSFARASRLLSIGSSPTLRTATRRAVSPSASSASHRRASGQPCHYRHLSGAAHGRAPAAPASFRAGPPSFARTIHRSGTPPPAASPKPARQQPPHNLCAAAGPQAPSPPETGTRADYTHPRPPYAASPPARSPPAAPA
jgi:hypothetical protein